MIKICHVTSANNYVISIPIKMFEYMATGLPFFASDFELWKRIVDKYPCGLCVNPVCIEEIQNACNRLLNNPEFAQNMGSTEKGSCF